MKIIGNFSRFVCIATAIIMLLTSFAGCEKNVSEDTEATTEEIIAEGPVLYENGSMRYTLIREEDASTSIINALKETVSALRALDKNFTYTDDFLKAGTEPDSEAYEILVGCTNRPESEAKKAELKAKDWYVGVSGNKILIIGGTDEATETAIAYFANAVAAAIEGGGERITLDGIAEECLYTAEYGVGEIKIAGTPISGYSIRYSTVSGEEAKDAAISLSSSIASLCGAVLATTKSAQGRQIVIGSCDDTGKELKSGCTDILDYGMKESEGSLFINGGGMWGIYGAVNIFAEDYVAAGTDIAAGFSQSGSAEGRLVFSRTGTSNLRIMTNNVWQCDDNQDAWRAIGEDCSAKNRAIGLAKAYAACKPDIICLQEMSTVMLRFLKNNLKEYGLEYKTLSPDSNCHTPILYNPETVTLEDNGFHMYTYGNNGSSKSYCWGYFKLNSTGEHFIALSTHLWWKSESVEPGSNTWRRMQAEEIVALSEELIAKYDCPMFIQGDLNCTTSSEAVQALIKGGFKTNYDLATVYKDNIRGHHQCDASGYATEMYSGSYTQNGIDHMLTKNLGDSEVQCFRHVVVDFFFNLSDHFPIFTDIKL